MKRDKVLRMALEEFRALTDRTSSHLDGIVESYALRYSSNADLRSLKRESRAAAGYQKEDRP